MEGVHVTVNLDLGDTRAIIAYAKGRGVLRNQLAYILATGLHETGHSMKAIKETVMPWHKDKNPSDAEVIRRLDRAFAKGQLSWVKSPYWRPDKDGKAWFGRGNPQITHKRNYVKLAKRIGIDIAADPDRVLETDVSVKIAVLGAMEGLFTGKKIPDYITLSKSDFFNARAVINGDKHKKDDGEKMGDRIAGYARAYDDALKAEGYGEDDHRPPVPPDVEPTPKKPVSPVTGQKTGGLGAIIAAILKLFGRK